VSFADAASSFLADKDREACQQARLHFGTCYSDIREKYSRGLGTQVSIGGKAEIERRSPRKSRNTSTRHEAYEKDLEESSGSPFRASTDMRRTLFEGRAANEAVALIVRITTTAMSSSNDAYSDNSRLRNIHRNQ
ncbi:carotenoid ester lipase precursor, partial [Moniliophthora roreri]